MADNERLSRDRDLVLAPGEYAYVLDTTKGLVNTIVGPSKISMSNTDQPVVWDRKRFVRVEADKAISLNAIAPEGFYIALYNPAAADKHPQIGTAGAGSAELEVGHRINVHGPANFALWPGQMAEVIRGHHLRSNQYLLIQVYNDAAATANWQSAVVKPQEGGETPVAPRQFTPGQLLVIKGTDVAFFMPPTGIKVVAAEGGSYVREAVTLERLEYCILLDENGKKRFVQGPNVVFPEPTEAFVMKDNQRKFRAIELNETSGLYIKVIADYKEGERQYKAGDELFITGREQAIYFQREEHSIIRYGDQTKHYAVAVPAGEGRYVLDRLSGAVTLRRGPVMLLCDPRTEVIVRRVLTDDQVRLWYPNNAKALQVNQALATLDVAPSDPTQYEAGRAATSNSAMNALYMADEQALRSRQVAGDVFNRGQKFTPPRTITLDTKYEGAVNVSVWPGYAVMVTNKQGGRRVVNGPEDVLMQYDEILAPVELSTGTPKVDTKLLRTVYLRVGNNQISDLVPVETQDLVKVNVRVSYRVDFIGESAKWFDVENYVKLLCDHMRSKIRNAAKRKGIEEFYGSTVDIVRDTVLGSVGTEAPVTPRPGFLFAENGMRVYDVEILGVDIMQPEIAKLLHGAQERALTAAVTIAQEERGLDVARRGAAVKEALATLHAHTAEEQAHARVRELVAQLDTSVRELANEKETGTIRLTNDLAASEIQKQLTDAELRDARERDKARMDALEAQVQLDIKESLSETEQVERRAKAISGDVAKALVTAADSALMKEIAESIAPLAAMHGISGVDVLKRLFKDSPLAPALDALASRGALEIAK